MKKTGLILLIAAAFLILNCDGGNKKKTDELEKKQDREPKMPNEPNLVPPLPT